MFGVSGIVSEPWRYQRIEDIFGRTIDWVGFFVIQLWVPWSHLCDFYLHFRTLLPLHGSWVMTAEMFISKGGT